MPTYLCQSIADNTYFLSELPTLANNLVVHMASNGSKMLENDMPVHWVNSYKMGHLWFEFWTVQTGWMYAFVLAFLFSLCIFSQFLYWFVTKQFDSTSANTYTAIEASDEQPEYTTGRKKIVRFLIYIAKMVCFALHTAISGFTMLAIMKYNVGAFLSLIIGNTVGWTIFSLLLGNSKMKNECH